MYFLLLLQVVKIRRHICCIFEVMNSSKYLVYLKHENASDKMLNFLILVMHMLIFNNSISPLLIAENFFRVEMNSLLVNAQLLLKSAIKTVFLSV